VPLWFALDRQLFQKHIHADLEDCIHDGEQPHQNKSVFDCKPAGKQLAERARANPSAQFTCMLFRRAQVTTSRIQRRISVLPARPMAWRIDLIRGKSKERRIQIAKAGVGNGGLLF